MTAENSIPSPPPAADVPPTFDLLPLTTEVRAAIDEMGWVTPTPVQLAAFGPAAEGSDIVLEHVGINPTRIGVINILRAMGGDLTVMNEREVGGEPVADIRIRSAKLKGIHIPEDQVPLAIDEFPVLFVAAACAEGTTVLTGAEELRGIALRASREQGNRERGHFAAAPVYAPTEDPEIDLPDGDEDAEVPVAQDASDWVSKLQSKGDEW